MKQKYLALSLFTVISSALLLLVSCKKINDSTTLGDGLIPPIDNIHTFDTTLDVEVYNDSFTIITDSTRYADNYEHFIGNISNDPFFGTTDARMFLQLKPSFYKYTYQNIPDSLHIDSVVLVLDYLETYGDTTALQTVNVYEISQTADFKYDSNYLIRQNNFAYTGLLGSRTFPPTLLNDSVRAFEDTTVNQLRVRLDDSFGARLLAYDTSAGTNGAYRTDSIFNTKFKGFALESTSGNAIMGFNLAGANTKLAIYYRYDKGGKLNADTTVAYWTFAANARSASAQYIRRGYSGTPVEAAIGQSAPAPIAYIQSTPGTLAKIKIPGLAGLNNRIVHRAELIMEQLYDMSDSTFSPPGLLFLDAYETTPNVFRTIPYDFTYDGSGSPDLVSLGSYAYFTKDPLGQTIRNWRFNLSRYVQHLVNGTEPAYDFRVSAPVYLFDLYKPPVINAESTEAAISVNPAAGKGRVRLHGGDATHTNPQRMRLRLVYSKI